MATIDVSRQVAEMELTLRGRENPMRRHEVLVVLERWQWDEMLDAPSRARARQLLREFGMTITPADAVAEGPTYARWQR